jgi:long-chain fatty acid transport protein
MCGPRRYAVALAMAATTTTATLVVAFGVSLLPARAAAAPLFELVGANLGSGGLNARAYGPSAASTYFNPALLPRASQGFELGVFVLNDAISITLDARSDAVAVPEAALNNFNSGTRSAGTSPALPTTWLANGCQRATGTCVTDLQAHPRQSGGTSSNTRAYQVVGLVNHLYKRYLTLGFYTLVPLGPFMQGHGFYDDEREQYFTNSLHPELYSDRLTSMSLSLGAGSQITKQLSIGLGFSLALANTATGSTYVCDATKVNDTLLLSTKLQVIAGVSPHVAVSFRPIDQLDLSATIHTPQKMQTDTASASLLPNGDSQTAQRRSVQAWLPWTLGLGLAYDFYETDRHVWAVTATGTYELWSDYVNRQGEQPQVNFGWTNTVSGGLGLRYIYDKKLTAILDGAYKPSPVPLQTGRTNYVDNNRYSFNGGVTYDMPVEKWGVHFRFGGQAQVHFLQPRHQTKIPPPTTGPHYSQLVQDEWSDAAVDSRGSLIPASAGLQTNNPGWPGFASKGFLLGMGLSAALLY